MTNTRRQTRDNAERYGDTLTKADTRRYYEEMLGGLLVEAGRALEVETRIALGR